MSTIASHGFAQAVIAAGSIIRLPFLVQALGQDGFGLSIAVGNLAPLLLATGGGLRVAARTIVSEEHGRSPRDRRDRSATIIRTGRRVATVQMAVSIGLVLLIPFHSLLQAGSIVSRGELQLTLLATAILCALAVPGAGAWGYLEATGRLVLVNTLIGVSAVVSLIATIILASVTESFAAFALINVGSSALPFFLAPLFVHLRRRAQSSIGQSDDDPRQTDSAVLRATGIGTVQNAAPFATRAMDPIVISSYLGPAAAAEYAIAQRIGMLTTFLPIAAGPFVTSYIARRRGSGDAVSYSGVVRLAATYASVAAAFGVLIVGFGPWLARILANDEFVAPRSLFVALALLGVTSSIHNAFHSAGTGPRALQFALRVDIGCTVLNVMLSLTLIRWVGIVGPVYASIAGSCVAVALWASRLHRNPDQLHETHLR